MFGGDNVNPPFLPRMDNRRLPYNCNVVPPMQFDVPVNYNGGTMNMIENNNASFVNIPMEPTTAAPIFSQQRLPYTLNNRIARDEGEQARNIWKQIPRSTGLKLSFGEEEHNSSVSSACETSRVNMSPILSHQDNIQMELVRQSNEFDQYIRIQEDNIRKGILELQQRHTISLLKTLEKSLNSRMREKDGEIENLNRKNKELMDKLRQLDIELQSWQYKAKQNESLVNGLRTNISQIVQQQAALVKEGYDENIVDDAVSSNNQNNLGPTNNVGIPSSSSTKETVICKECNTKEACVLLVPCRHLCLCTDCEGVIEICPVCRVKKGGSLQVLMS